MDESQLQVFIEGTVNYFGQVTKSNAEVGAPYLIDDARDHCQRYTGALGISGRNRGVVYFTASRSTLVHLMASLGEPDVSEGNLLDLVGEVANTISGNARRDFGSEFMISVPVLFSHDEDPPMSSDAHKTYAIPILWRNHCSNLVISLD